MDVHAAFIQLKNCTEIKYHCPVPMDCIVSRTQVSKWVLERSTFANMQLNTLCPY